MVESYIQGFAGAQGVLWEENEASKSVRNLWMASPSSPSNRIQSLKDESAYKTP